MYHGVAVCSRYHVSEEEFVMASKMKAMVKYGPRIVGGQPAHDEDAILFMTQDTGQTDGEAKQSISNVIRTLRFFLVRGASVYIDDLGLFYPEMGLDGKISIHFRADPDLTDYVNVNFLGNVENADNIGKKLVDLVALWNADPENANDLIVLS
ncbi:MAG: hypothetical protein AUJ92_10625 [Armatimonadetes bacterium CG2_30_59_28]|nr:MAG: hypothetical protein AUJ92_10625 [Armatimonadetes bacterium CG2_30_59_28]